MKASLRWSFFCLSLLGTFHGTLGENLQECIDPADFDPKQDYFPDKVVVEVAEHFSIEYYGYYKIVRNDEDDQTYVLVQCGAPSPTAEELELQANVNISDVAFTVEVPLQRVALQYSTMEVFFEVLGARRTITATLGTSFSTASCMRQMVDDGLIIELNDTLASLSADYINEQGSLEVNPTLAEPFSVDNLVGFIGRTNWNSKSYPFPYIRSSDTLEPSREGLFEKVKFYAAFLNREARAREVWDQVQERISCVQTNAAAIQLEHEAKTTILWAGFSAFCQGWDVARTGPFYYNDFADVCSANLLTAEMGGNLVSPVERCVSPDRRYMSYEDFLEFGKDADVWIWPSPNAPPLNDDTVFTEAIKSFKAYVNQQIYYPGGSTGWFDQAYIQPDVMIEDFCSLSGTLDLETGEEYQRRWFRNVFTNDVNVPNPTCEELGGIDTPRETSGSDCAIRTPPPVSTPVAPAPVAPPVPAPVAPPVPAPVAPPVPAPVASPVPAPVAPPLAASPPTAPSSASVGTSVIGRMAPASTVFFAVTAMMWL